LVPTVTKNLELFNSKKVKTYRSPRFLFLLTTAGKSAAKMLSGGTGTIILFVCRFND
jgi:hypothetical protein